MKKILIAIPCKNDIEAETFKCIYDLITPAGYETEFQYFYGYAVDQVRNLIAHRAIEWGFDYLLAIDHDMIFPRDTLVKLIAHDKDIVTGVYRQRTETCNLELYSVTNMNRLENIPCGLFEVGGCGFGCILVKVDVFRKIGYPYFVYHQAIDHRDTLSEDIDFCNKARYNGYSIYCDPSILCGHIGEKVFEVPISPEEQRFYELSNTRLLPKDHIAYLHSMDIEEPKVIYDIGACVLHWTKEAYNVWPNSRFVVFDAMEGQEFLYQEHGLDYVCGVVLHDEDGVVLDFYENKEHPGGNSIYEENPELSPRARELFNTTVKKEVRTLDSLVSELNIPLPDLIKIDIQGAELNMLRGATNTISNCKDIIIELQHKDYNIGAPKNDEVTAYLNSIGFELVNRISEPSSLGVDADYHFTRTKNCS